MGYSGWPDEVCQNSRVSRGLLPVTVTFYYVFGLDSLLGDHLAISHVPWFDILTCTSKYCVGAI